MTAKQAKAIMIFWIVLLVPWLVFAGLVGMALDGGPGTAAYLLIGSVWTYPLVVLAASILRRRKPALILLPILNFLPVAAAFILNALGVKG
jgi:hypothetical protein